MLECWNNEEDYYFFNDEYEYVEKQVFINFILF